MSTKNGKKLRSQEWWGQPNYESFTRRAWMRSEGFSSDFFQNKPVIGICNSWSEFNNCNAHLRTVAEAVKRGVLAAGGFPLEFPTISLGEVYMKPTTMTSLAEALGMTLTGSANIPAPDSRRLTIAEMSGRRAVELALEDVKPSQIMTRQAIENAITVDMAIGGSTNAVVHLLAIAGRL